MLQELGFYKAAIFGGVMTHIGAGRDNPYEDYSSADLKRIQRKLTSKGMKVPQRLANQVQISEQVEKLRGKVEAIQDSPIKFRPWVHGGVIVPEGPMLIKARSPYSLVAGHEFGHAYDKLHKGKNYMTDTSVPISKARLRYERSASRHILDKLPPDIQRSEGKDLAHSYQTYITHTKMPKEIDKIPAAKILNRRKSIGTMMDNASAGDFWRGIEHADFDKYVADHINTPRFKKKQRIELNKRVVNNIAESMKARHAHQINIEKARLAKRQEAARIELIDYFSRAKPSTKITALRQAAREVRDAKKAFGPHVAAGVRDDFRSIIENIALKAVRKGK